MWSLNGRDQSVDRPDIPLPSIGTVSVGQDEIVKSSPDRKVTLSLGGDFRALARFLDDRIYELNVEATGLDDGEHLMIQALNVTGEMVAGLAGWTWGGCGYVDDLWVAETYRGAGIGTRLMNAAETEAVARGCQWMVLSTHTFQAPDFYRARGYEEVGRTPGYPVGGAQVHLRKALVMEGRGQ